MVKLSRIYTRGGDGGQTSLGGGARVAKQDPRIGACGAVDEANAAVGLARLHATGEAAEMLARIQDDLFDLGADLSYPDREGGGAALRIVQGQVDRLEAEIDAMNGQLSELTSFVLPGGTPASAHLHLARTIARRAERAIAALAEREPVNPLALKFVNRLSDHLFVLGRFLNDKGANDVLWRPGANRPGTTP
ncbi:MAG: cob(I)yrinic acid a,c-diamide adenosyltransferase [Alphaproteobacteria bacterium]|nr:cob(I)yrinic acid a,c-diamide adenosyltransferase [Alphaproteobacteria bacterium]